MKLLIVSATEAEIGPLLDHLNSTWTKAENKSYTGNGGVADVCITGVGMLATAYALTKALAGKKYDLALQVGICGAFDMQLKLEELVYISGEQLGDMGAEDHENYIDIFEMGLVEKYVFPFINTELIAPKLSIPLIDKLTAVSSLSVNTVSGNERTIKKRIEKFDCQVESMEGAAFHYVCLNENVSFAQVRSISNYVAPRDKSKWKIKEAITALNQWLLAFVENEK
jgi:futalosine hydrolase